MFWLQYSKFSIVSSLFCSHENAHKLFFPKFSFKSLAFSHSYYFLHLSPPKFFPLTKFPQIFFPLSLSLRDFMSSLLLILTLFHGNLSFSPDSSSLFFPSIGPICHRHPLHSHPLPPMLAPPPPPSSTSNLAIRCGFCSPSLLLLLLLL